MLDFRVFDVAEISSSIVGILYKVRVVPRCGGLTCGLITQGVVSNPTRVTIKSQLARKARGITLYFPRPTQSPVSDFCYA